MPGTTAKYFADANRRTNYCTDRCTDWVWMSTWSSSAPFID